MTNMEIKTLIYKVLKIVGYALGTIGVLKLFGAVGYFEWDYLTFGEFVYQEFVAFALIFSSYIIYLIRENFRVRCIRCKTRHYVK